VKSRNYFEQMKGRGVRVISPEDFQQVTRDARMKDHFVLIDCVGITENELTDAPPLEKKYSVAFEKLLQSVSFGSHDPDIVSSLAGRLARLNQQLGKAEKERIEADSGGLTLNDIVGGMIEALDPDRQIAAANLATGQSFDAEPDPAALADVQRQVLERALSPLTDNPKLRETILTLKKSHEQTIDRVTEDKVIDAGFTKDGRDRAAETVQSFREFIEANRDEISALQILYSRPWAKRLRFEDIRELAAAISTPPRSWTPDSLWQAYAQLEQGKVRGSGRRVLTDLVALVRHAIGEEPELVPFEDGVNARFDAWLAAQEAGGRLFTAEQRRCLEEIRDQIAQSFRIELDDFEYVPFAQSGGLGKVYALFGDELQPLLDELNEVLVA
jgi:type I restriction enzyme R subunit